MSVLHLKIFRIVLGLYLIQHFAHLVPSSTELFSNQGVFPDVRALPSYGVFPNPLFLIDTPLFATLFVAVLCVLSILLTIGWHTRLVALVLWFGWAALLSRAPFIANPSIPFIGLLLLGLAALPSVHRGEAERAASLLLWRGVWVIMALSYTISGVHKMGSPSWVDGSALSELMQNPLARDFLLTAWISAFPSFVLSMMTWGALALEILFAPLAFFSRSRPWVWGAMIVLHGGILCMVSFADLTAGMLLVHLFTFDERWVRARASGAERPLVFFDGTCVMCNGFATTLIEVDEAARIALAPLYGETFSERISVSERASLPDSIVFVAPDGKILTKSDGVIAIGHVLGGIPGVLAFLCLFFPRSFRNYIYDVIASVRYRLFGKTEEICSLIPPEVRTRLLP